MKGLQELEKENFIAIAKMIDNDFTDMQEIIVSERKNGIVKVIGYTHGRQCIECDVKIDIKDNKLNGVYNQNDNPDSPGCYKMVYPPTLKNVIDYLKANDFDFCPSPNSEVVA